MERAGRPTDAKDSNSKVESPAPVDVRTLLAGRQEVRLLHRGQEYRLRITRAGKLILTK